MNNRDDDGEPSPEVGRGRWHDRPAALRRVVGDLIAGELRNLRPSTGRASPSSWTPDSVLGEGGIGLDSLERMEVAAAISDALHLHEGADETALLSGHTLGDWLATIGHGLARCDARLSFRTSGSSGSPKPCVHALGDLQQEVDFLAARFVGAKRVLAAVPAHHIYGFLFTVLLPRALGDLEVVDVRSVAPRTLARLLRAGDLLVGHPASWALVARHAGAVAPGVTGVSSTAPCPVDLALELTRAPGGLDRLVQVYGSSETAGVGWRDQADGWFELMPFWSREPSSSAVLRRRAPDGRFRGVALQDRVEWLDATHFRVGARVDAAVQVGGVNVFPERVRALLLTHPRVADAAVRLMTATEGRRLKAFIVPAAAADPRTLGAELEGWCESRLSPPERPKAWTLGRRLPVGEQGKAADWAVIGDDAGDDESGTDDPRVAIDCLP